MKPLWGVGSWWSFAGTSILCMVGVFLICGAQAAPLTSAASKSSFYDFIFQRYAPPSSARSSSSSSSSSFDSAAKAINHGSPHHIQACNCTSSESCCYWHDRPFCCGSSSTCCGSQCCPATSVCCRSKWGRFTSCCESARYCTSRGECSVVPINQGNWALLPLMIGSFVVTIVVCCCTCICISRVNRRRAILAAVHNPGLLGGPSDHLGATNSAYRTFQPRGSYSKSLGVSSKTLQTFPTHSYVLGCMPAENAVCSICLLEYEPEESLRTLPCQHHYHQQCIDRWLSDHDTCPLCVQVVSTHSVRVDK